MDIESFVIMLSSNASIATATWVGASGAIATWLTLYASSVERHAKDDFEMRYQYDSLAKSKEIFWKNLREAYSKYSETNSALPKTLENCIRAAGCPPNVGKIELRLWSEAYALELSSDKRFLWDFCQLIYPPRNNHEGQIMDYSLIYEGDDFHEARASLAKFWNRWIGTLAPSGILGYFGRRRIRKKYSSARYQWIMLSWLEVALIQWTKDPGEGKIWLFKLASEAK